MLKLLFIIFYEPKNYLNHIKQQFERRGIEVDTYPLFRYAYDSNDKMADYKHHLNTHIQETSPDMIFWWFIDVPTDVFQFISQQNPGRFFAIYNSDDPFNLSKDLFDVCKNFDLIITPSQPSLNKYRRLSHAENVIYFPFGVDPDTFLPIECSEEELAKYQCDISLYSHNFYLNKEIYPNQAFYSLDFIKELDIWTKEQGYSFRLYGAPVIREYFPHLYHGDLPYHEINSLYNCSRINLSFHGDCSVGPALNQHDVAIMAAGGLLVSDYQKGSETFLVHGENSILIEPVTFREHLAAILKDYPSPAVTTVRQRARETSLQYSWSNLTDQIIQIYAQKYFDASLYSAHYRYFSTENNNERQCYSPTRLRRGASLNAGSDYSENDSSYQHWLANGFEQGIVCYPFIIPESFNHDDYIANSSLEFPEIDEKYHRQLAYCHWFRHSKSEIYLIPRKTASLDPATIGVVMDQYYQVCSILGKLRTAQPDQKVSILRELDQLCRQSPGIKINEIVEAYLTSL